MTISAAERFMPSSSLMPVGMPRPLSSTEMELSVWMVTTISSQKPASASSTELSTTSNTMWCRPVPSEVSPMYMPGRLRTASRPFKTLIASEPYSLASGRCLSGSPTLNPHRHDHILEILLRRVADERARGRVAEGAFHGSARDIVQHIEQVVDVKPDIERVAGVLHIELLLRFLLLGVGRHEFQTALREHPAHAAEFLVRKDRRALQRLAQGLALRVQPVLVLGRDHARVIRELAVDQLRHHLDRAEAECRLGRRELDCDFLVAVGEELGELQHRLSWHDDLLARQLRVELERRVGKAMPVRRHQLQLPILHHHEQAVQVVTDILLRHRVLHQAEQPAQRLLAEREARGLARRLCQAREVLRRQRLQREARSEEHTSELQSLTNLVC